MKVARFRSKAFPGNNPGTPTLDPKIVVPDQSLSLREILERFTRGEPLHIGKDVQYDESGDDDLEKVSKMDLVERDEFIQKQKDVQDRYSKQEKRKAAAEKKRLDELAVQKLVEEKKQGEKPGDAK